MHTDGNKSRLWERRAVNASRAFFEECGLVFQEVDLRNDIGKDAILDLARSGVDAGLTVALQIKGGKKYKRQSGHAIPIDSRLREVWRNSSIPIFVIVLDPDDGELYWGNLISMAEMISPGVQTAPVSPDVRLTPDCLEQFMKAARLECASRRSDPLLNLTSADPSLLKSALVYCLAVGRRDPRYFRLIKSSLSGISDQDSFYMAIHLLAHATSHPDIFWHQDNIITEDACREIRKSFRWAPNDISMLLARLPEEGGWSRGTIGQSLYMIISVDPSLEWSIDRLLTESFRVQDLTWLSCWVKGPPFGPGWVRTDREAVILPSLTLDLYLAPNPQERLAELTERLPPIQRISMFQEISEVVTEFGGIDIF